MTLLTALGLVSFAFVVAFTARAYKDDAQGNGQSRRTRSALRWPINSAWRRTSRSRSPISSK